MAIESYWTPFPRESGCSPLPDFWVCRFEKETKPKVSVRKSWRLRSVGVFPVKRYEAVIPPPLPTRAQPGFREIVRFRILRAMAAHSERSRLRQRGLREAARNRSLSCQPKSGVPALRPAAAPRNETGQRRFRPTAAEGAFADHRAAFLQRIDFGNVSNRNPARLAEPRPACYPLAEAMQIGDRP